MSIRWVPVVSLILCACAPSDDPVPESADPADIETVVESTAAEHEGDSPDATPISEVPPASEVVAQDVPYGEEGDLLLSGYFVLPAAFDESLPGIIMIHEWWGLNDNIRAMARRLAGEGYAVLAVDLYRGEIAATPADAQALMAGVLNDRAAVMANLEQAHAFLNEFALAPRLAILGWCLGGGFSLEAGLAFGNDLDAVVMFYGQVINNDDRLMELDAPLLGLFAALDESIPAGDVREFRNRLRDLGKEAEVLIFPDADHAFANPSGTAYNHTAATEAWDTALGFLDTELR